jgi:hypothetical protein
MENQIEPKIERSYDTIENREICIIFIFKALKIIKFIYLNI